MRGIFLIILLHLSASAFTQCAEKYYYADGSNNIYLWTGDSLIYEPVRPENSSSGEYSGGKRKAVATSEEENKILKNAFSEACKAKDQHQKDRAKGTGMIYKKCKKKAILSMNSAAQMELELTLTIILNKS